MRLAFIVFTSIFYTSAFSQNSGFEKTDGASKKPLGWVYDSKKTGFTYQIDSTIKYKGKYSLCIARDTSITTDESGSVSYTIPAIYEGATIKLIGYVRTENVDIDGGAGLLIRLENSSKVLEQDNMEVRKITGTKDWKKYSLELNLADDIKKIVIGGWMKGKHGRVWLDELNVYIDTKDLDHTHVFNARLDSTYSKGSGIQFPRLNRQQIKNLQTLGQVWGFLKYHHPAVASGNLNWDYELFRILPRYLKNSSIESRNQYLHDWIDSFGSIPECSTCKESPDSLLKMPVDLKWLNGSDIGNDLKQQLFKIRKNRSQGNHYYVSQPRMGAGNAEFTNEDPYEQFLLPDAGFRLLALFRYWNIIQYYFPYRYAIGDDWNRVLLESIEEFVGAQNNLEYRKAVVKLMNRIHDTHANLWGRDTVWSNYKGKYIPVVQTKFVEDKLVVTNFHFTKITKKNDLQLGDIITKVNGRSVDKILKEKIDFYPASNYSTKLRDIAKDILRGNNRAVTIEVLRNNKTLQISIPRFPLDSVNTNLDKSYSLPDSCYQFVNADIGYIHVGSIKTSLLPRIFNTFKSTKGIIVDIRNYPNEFVVFPLSSQLLSSTAPFAKITLPDVNQAGNFIWSQILKVGSENNDAYRGKIAVLVNEITQSQAEFLTMALQASKNTIVIGSTTAGADGNISIFYLPGKLRTMISGVGVYYPNKRETQRIGITPDIFVRPTIKGVKAQRDELLEKAIEVIHK